MHGMHAVSLLHLTKRLRRASLKVYVIYDSKYGNTKAVAASIFEGLKQAGLTDVMIDYVKDVDPKVLVDYDALVIGAPNHMGKPSWTMQKFAGSLPQTGLRVRWAVAFDTYFQRQRYYQKAMKKLERQISERLQGLAIIAPGLSVRVNGVNGPVANGELDRAVEFGRKIGVELQTV
jgi:flavorubredoxin